MAKPIPGRVSWVSASVLTMFMGAAATWSYAETQTASSGVVVQSWKDAAESAAAAPNVFFAQNSLPEMIEFDRVHPALPHEPKPFVETPAGWDMTKGRYQIAAELGAPGSLPTQQSSNLAGAPAPPSTFFFAPPLITNFMGIFDNNTTIPPDTHGAVGPNHVVEFLNNGFRVFSRTGTALTPLTSLAAFWAPTGVSALSDPKTMYDQFTDRWIVTAVGDFNSATAIGKVMIGISTSNDPTGSWNLFFILADTSGATWADYEGIGFDDVNVYLTARMFTVSAFPAFATSRGWVVSKASLIAGGPLDFSAFILSAPVSTAYQPTHSFDTTVTGLSYFVSQNFSSGAQRFLSVLQFTGIGSAAVVTTLPLMEVNTYNFTQTNAPQPNCATNINTNDPRILNTVMRNGKVWATHSVADAVGKTEVAWYELDPLNGLVLQQGRVSDPNLWFYFPSIAVNADECVAVGFTGSGPSQYATGYYTLRRAADSPGTMQGIAVLKDGLQPYWKQFGGTRNRWGDYSATVVDPVDDLTFWTVQEYAEVQFAPGGATCASDKGRWSTWWGQFPCPNTEQPLPAPAPDDVLKNRYVSFVPNNPFAPVAFRVSKTTAPVGECWVQTPEQTPGPTQFTARCGTSPVFRLWTESVVSVGDCSIVPVSGYAVSATDNGTIFSPPLVVNTISQPAPKFWADVAGINDGSMWTPPNQITNVQDIVAILAYIGNASIKPTFQMANLQAVSSADPCLNTLVNTADLFICVKAAAGDAYPFTTNPANCPVCP